MVMLMPAAEMEKFSKQHLANFFRASMENIGGMFEPLSHNDLGSNILPFLTCFHFVFSGKLKPFMRLAPHLYVVNHSFNSIFYYFILIKMSKAMKKYSFFYTKNNNYYSN